MKRIKTWLDTGLVTLITIAIAVIIMFVGFINKDIFVLCFGGFMFCGCEIEMVQYRNKEDIININMKSK